MIAFVLPVAGILTDLAAAGIALNSAYKSYVEASIAESTAFARAHGIDRRPVPNPPPQPNQSNT